MAYMFTRYRNDVMNILYNTSFVAPPLGTPRIINVSDVHNCYCVYYFNGISYSFISLLLKCVSKNNMYSNQRPYRNQSAIFKQNDKIN